MTLLHLKKKKKDCSHPFSPKPSCSDINSSFIEYPNFQLKDISHPSLNVCVCVFPLRSLLMSIFHYGTMMPVSRTGKFSLFL